MKWTMTETPGGRRPTEGDDRAAGRSEDLRRATTEPLEVGRTKEGDDRATKRSEDLRRATTEPPGGLWTNRRRRRSRREVRRPK
jgi:hypothetical protein